MNPTIQAQFLEATNPVELKQAIAAAAELMGFPLYGMVYFGYIGCGAPTVVRVHNVPPAFQEGHVNAVNSRRDPVCLHLRSRTTPIIYDRDTYLTAGLPDLWEEQDAHGYSTGIATTVRLGDGRQMSIGFDTPRALSTNDRYRTNLLADLTMIAMLSSHGCERILRSQIDRAATQIMPTKPTARELEVLYLASRGRSSAETAGVLGISLNTVEGHIRSAMDKLGASRKAEAVMAAMRMELILP